MDPSIKEDGKMVRLRRSLGTPLPSKYRLEYIFKALLLHLADPKFICRFTPPETLKGLKCVDNVENVLKYFDMDESSSVSRSHGLLSL